MYRPLGTGDVDAIVSVPGRRGYEGWYVLERDTILTGEPPGEGPVADVRTGAEYVRSVLSKTAGSIPYWQGRRWPAAGGSGPKRCRASPPTVGIALGSSRTVEATERLL